MFMFYRALGAAQLILCTSPVWAAAVPAKEARKAYQEGLRLEAANQPERAIQAYSEAIRFAPDYVEAYEHRGQLSLANGHPAAATRRTLAASAAREGCSQAT